MNIQKYYEFINNIPTDLYILELIKNIEEKYPNTSNLNDIWNNPSYKKIIENGNNSINLLINKLDDSSCVFWFNALEKITNKNFSGKPKEKKELWKKLFKYEYK